jgi:hypothetical protein
VLITELVKGKASYLLRGTLASPVPVSIIINVSQSSPLVHRVERKEMNFSNPSSCLPNNNEKDYYFKF